MTIPPFDKSTGTHRNIHPEDDPKNIKGNNEKKFNLPPQKKKSDDERRGMKEDPQEETQSFKKSSTISTPFSNQNEIFPSNGDKQSPFNIQPHAQKNMPSSTFPDENLSSEKQASRKKTHHHKETWLEKEIELEAETQQLEQKKQSQKDSHGKMTSNKKKSHEEILPDEKIFKEEEEKKKKEKKSDLESQAETFLADQMKVLLPNQGIGQSSEVSKVDLSKVTELIQKMVNQILAGNIGQSQLTTLNLKSTEVPPMFAGSSITLTQGAEGLMIKFENFQTPQNEIAALKVIQENPAALKQLLSNLNAKNVQVAQIQVGDHSIGLSQILNPQNEVKPNQFQENSSQFQQNRDREQDQRERRQQEPESEEKEE